MREVLPGGREHGGVGGAEEAKHRLAWDAAEKAHTRVEAELERAPLESRPFWPVARDHERHVRHPPERLEQDADRLLRAEPSGEHEDVAVELELGTKLLARRHRRDRGCGIGQNRHAPCVEPPTQRDIAEVRARAEDVSRSLERRVPRRAEEAQPTASSDALELVERPDVAAAARRALEDLVGHELHDERPPRETGADGGSPDHARRVDDVGAARGSANEQR